MPNITLASWNVNSVRARLPVFQEWIQRVSPDILCLQETKCEDISFPQDIIEDLGYNVAHFGQKTFNGVAILSKFPISAVVRDFEDFEHLGAPEKPYQARYIEAEVEAHGACLRIASVYVPNGESVGTDKYAYKLRFLEALYTRMHHVLSFQEAAFFCGDYNIAPSDKDVYDPSAWKDRILCSQPEREGFFKLLHAGYTDPLAFESAPPFTWWDYRRGSFEQNRGLRIDHILASPQGSDLIEHVHVDCDVRGVAKTSDHAPVIATLTLQNN